MSVATMVQAVKDEWLEPGTQDGRPGYIYDVEFNITYKKGWWMLRMTWWYDGDRFGIHGEGETIEEAEKWALGRLARGE